MDNFGEGLSPREYQKAAVATQAERVATFKQNNPAVSLPAAPENNQIGEAAMKSQTGETANTVGEVALSGVAIAGAVVEAAMNEMVAALQQQQTPDQKLKILVEGIGDQQQRKEPLTAIGEAMQPVTPEPEPEVGRAKKGYSLSEWIDLPLSERQAITKQAVENKPEGMPDEIHAQYVKNVQEAHEVNAERERLKAREQSDTDRYGEYITRVMNSSSVDKAPVNPSPTSVSPRPQTPVAKAA